MGRLDRLDRIGPPRTDTLPHEIITKIIPGEVFCVIFSGITCWMRNFLCILLRGFIFVKFAFAILQNHSLKIFLRKVCFICLECPAVEGWLPFLSLSLLLSFSLSPSFSLSWPRVPLICFLAHGANRTGIFIKNRFVGAVEFPWLVLCVLFRFFPDFCVLDNPEWGCLYLGRLSQVMMLEFPKCMCFGRLKILKFPGYLPGFSRMSGFLS